MNELIGTSPLGLAMIKHKNEIIARNGLGMGAKNINGKLRSTLAKRAAMIALQQKEFHATTAQHAKEIKALTATVKEQASQIQKVSDRLEHLNERKRTHDLEIISRAACLTELASNSKSFSNCPDLHGGAPGLPGDIIWMKPALGKEKVVPLPWIKGFGPVADRGVSGKLFFRPERNKPKSYSSYKTRERE